MPASPLLYGQVAPKRLSNWLLEQPVTDDAYLLGLSWRIPEEVPAQYSLRLTLLKSLSGLDPEVTAEPVAMGRLGDWLSTLPVTGRVPVSVPDAQWLQANPSRDPILRPGHSAVLPRRPGTVTVVTEQGRRCAVTHAPGREAKAYLEACNPVGALRTDWVWIAQPDGRVQRFGVATWNREQQDGPAPGAWIWGPPRNSGWPESFSQRLIAFLATQGPAPDPMENLQTCNANATSAAESKPGVTPPGGASQGFRLSGPGEVPGGPHARQCEDHPSDANANRSAGAVETSGVTSGQSRGLKVTTGDWGDAGLLQTPTARMQSAGHFSFNYSQTQPYSHANIFLQPFDWLEAGFRYSAIDNRPYNFGGAVTNGQSYKDKSADVKIRLWRESAYAPQVAVGLRDIGGTGLYSGEYFVANKRAGAFDWSLGLGWGYVGGRGNLRNPFSIFSTSFNTRKINSPTDQGGSLRFGDYFRGPTALFGGLQYQTPWEKLILKIEYDGNNYRHEPQSNNQKQSSPWNFGLVYRAGRSADLTVGLERGNTIMLGFTLHTQLDRLSTPKVSDPPAVAVAATRPRAAPDWSLTSRDIARQTDWAVRRIEQRDNELRVTVDDADAAYWRERLDRAAAVLHRDAPASVDRFTLAYREGGIEMAEHEIDRDAWVTARTQPVPPGERREAVIARAPEQQAPGTLLAANTRPKFESGFSFGFAPTLGGPDAFLLYQMYGEERAKFRISDDTWLQGGLRLRAADNYNRFTFDALSNLPRVRSYVREYVTSSRVTLPNLQLTHVGALTENQYYSVYGGYLEEMFAGAGAEWLYRPFASRVALGIDVNAVRQRNFLQNLGFGNAGTQTRYDVATGHATLYWDTGWNNVLAKISAGRYLAKDAGVTVDMSRVFKNGVSVGVFATKTNVSAAQFGEGGFDKGIYVNIPFDAFLTRSTNDTAGFLWRPLIRDGGAKLARSVALYDVTNARDDRTLKFEPAPPPNDVVIPADRREGWQPAVTQSEPYTRVPARPPAAQWAPDTTYRRRLIEALYQQQFRNIRVDYDGSQRLTVALSNDRIHPISRAVGRAARTALRLAPLEAREIRITLAAPIDPVVTYNFIDLARLQRYFDGALKPAELADSIAIEYLNPSAREYDPLARLDDVESVAADSSLANTVLPDSHPVDRVVGDVAAAVESAKNANWFRAGVTGAGLVLASSALDSSVDRFARNHGDNRWLKAATNAGNAIPWLALAGSAVAAFDGSDPARSRTGYAALEAGGTSVLVASGLQYAIGRARPEQNAGNHSFKPFSATAGYTSFPSVNTIVAWSVVTPFAKEYDAPWLYGVAAITNFARAEGRKHWLSDTVAGSLLGYGIGTFFWEASRARNPGEPRVLLGPSGIKLSWDWN